MDGEASAGRVDDGGDPACWLRRVGPACGGLAEQDPPTRGPRCGERFEDG